ncbi:MAG: MoaD/ThiS family protein [Spirochaetota bacterium]
MKITVSAFSSVKTACGFTEEKFELNEKASVGDALKVLCGKYGNLSKMKGGLLFAVNDEYCDESRILKDGDILAVFPPVSGG